MFRVGPSPNIGNGRSLFWATALTGTAAGTAAGATTGTAAGRSLDSLQPTTVETRAARHTTPKPERNMR